MGEFAQLTAYDIKMDDAGRAFIDLLHTGKDEQAKRRRLKLDLKNATSRRQIPVPDNAHTREFLSFVERRRKRNGDQALLFSDARTDDQGSWSNIPSKRLNRLIDKVNDDPRYVVHSMRHNFVQACRDAGIAESTISRWTGPALKELVDEFGRRSSGTTTTARVYGSPELSPSQIDEIGLVRFEGSV
ncbi:MAG: hypothetical protein AAGH38_11425 [Pseudomonadota bacterium]